MAKTEKVENKEHNITFEGNQDTDIADNNITYEKGVKNQKIIFNE